MENLGSMEPEELLQLLTGSVACAFVIFLFIIVYVLISRRGRRVRGGTDWGAASSRQDTLSRGYGVKGPPTAVDLTMPDPSDTLREAGLYEDEGTSVDVSARLAGTGREAWLEQESSDMREISAPEERAPDHGQEVLRLLRDPLTGQLWTQIAGTRYRSLKDIRDRTVGQRVLATITHVLRFSNGRVATDQGVVALEIPPCDVVEVPRAFGSLSGAPEPGEIIRLMSDPDQDRFCVHVAGHCYRQLVDVTDGVTGQYILEAITRLLQFSGGMLATNDGVGVVPVPPLRADAQTRLPTPPVPEPGVSESAASPAPSASGPDTQLARSPVASTDADLISDEEERFLQQLAGQTPAQPETRVERPSLIGGLRRMRQQASIEAVGPLNLAAEIDRIFQSKLLASRMSTTNAKVETNPDGGVRIRIGTVYYSSPDEVPDPYLRDMLKLSIAEWEQS